MLRRDSLPTDKISGRHDCGIISRMLKVKKQLMLILHSSYHENLYIAVGAVTPQQSAFQAHLMFIFVSCQLQLEHSPHNRQWCDELMISVLISTSTILVSYINRHPHIIFNYQKWTEQMWCLLIFIFICIHLYSLLFASFFVLCLC